MNMVRERLVARGHMAEKPAKPPVSDSNGTKPKRPKRTNPNKRQPKTITYNGETKTLGQWAKVVGCDEARIRYRLSVGYSPEKCLDPNNWKGSAINKV